MNLKEKSVGPYQYYVAMRYDPSVSDIREAPLYPLVRSIYSINLEGKVGLGQGFAAYVASELGQRTILRFGLVPATMPVRFYKSKRKNSNQVKPEDIWKRHSSFHSF
ncbi:MAG: hypothetical protein IPG53_17140 [Ignavibacteriales bacterium]|nr:hypothetical protein [Ignavibacteriales bacterium]